MVGPFHERTADTFLSDTAQRAPLLDSSQWQWPSGRDGMPPRGRPSMEHARRIRSESWPTHELLPKAIKVVGVTRGPYGPVTH